MASETHESYIAAVDVGTTSIRCQIINSQALCISTASETINLLYPQLGYVEIDPDELWNNVCNVIRKAISSANLIPSQITCLGVSTQRATFTTWRKDNGKPFHNFITWKDLRSDALVHQCNSSLTMKGFRMSCYALYLVSRYKRFLVGSNLKITNTQTTMRLVWVLQNIPNLKQAVQDKNAMFGTIDTWLIYKFTLGKMHVTDVTNASATGFFDPFVLSWSAWASIILSIPFEILPKVVDNDHSFGFTETNIFGVSIPIKCIISDQSASMFGSCCFNGGEAKITLGTGSFIDVNTKQDIHGSAAALYPLVGWKFNNEIVYFLEGACNDTGSLIQWAMMAGLIENPFESSTLANQLEHNDGVYFIPAFSGLGPPFMDDNAATGFIGLKVTSTKHHMVRSILESIVYRIVLLYNMMKYETDYKIKRICVDGGVSNNDFVCQLLANILGLEIERPSSTEMTILGVAFAAGLKSE